MNDELHERVRHEVASLAARCGNAGVQFGDDDIIPELGILDSAAIIELTLWIEKEFRFVIDEDDLTIENLGSVSSIVAYVKARRRVS